MEPYKRHNYNYDSVVHSFQDVDLFPSYTDLSMDDFRHGFFPGDTAFRSIPVSDFRFICNSNMNWARVSIVQIFSQSTFWPVEHYRARTQPSST